MKRTLLFVLVGACTPQAAGELAEQHPQVEARAALDRPLLPNWATPQEQREQANAPRVDIAEVAPPAGYRVPAEYEPVQAVVLAWAGSSQMLSEIARAVAGAGAEAWVVGGPASISGVPAAKYKALDIDFNSIWVRDYGPVGIDEASHTLAIVDSTYRHHASRRADDALPCHLASTMHAACYPTELILDGGNYMTDGEGNVFLSRRVYDWNSHLSADKVDDLLRSHFASATIHILDYASEVGGYPADGTGHIDMFAKLVAPCKVIVAQSEDEPFKTTTDKAASYFAQLTCGNGTYQVFRVPGWLDGSTWYTYTNSLIVNQSVVLPFYDAGDNAAAAQVYQSALPGYTIIGVNSEDTIGSGGSIHCITKDIPRL